MTRIYLKFINKDKVKQIKSLETIEDFNNFYKISDIYDFSYDALGDDIMELGSTVLDAMEYLKDNFGKPLFATEVDDVFNAEMDIFILEPAGLEYIISLLQKFMQDYYTVYWAYSKILEKLVEPKSNTNITTALEIITQYDSMLLDNYPILLQNDFFTAFDDEIDELAKYLSKKISIYFRMELEYSSQTKNDIQRDNNYISRGNNKSDYIFNLSYILKTYNYDEQEILIYTV